MLTTHYMEEAEHLCDRVAIMDHGSIIEIDRPSALIVRYFKETAIEFTTAGAWPAERAGLLPGVKHSLVDDSGRVVVYTSDVPQTMAGLFTILIPILFAAFFGAIFRGGSNYQLQMGLVVEDSGPIGKQLMGSLTSPEAQKMLNVKIGSRDEELAALGKGGVQVVLVLPSGLSDSLTAGKQKGLEVFYDAVSQSSSGIGLGVVRNLLADVNLSIQGLEPLLVAEEMVGYSALYPLWLDFTVLLGCLIIFVGLGLRFFRWEQ